MSAAGEAKRKRARWQTALAIVFTLAALVWVGDLVRVAWPTLADAMRHVDAPMMGMAALACLAGAATHGEMFHILVREFCAARMSRSQTYSLQFVAQLVRHLPGRFWGVAYQIAQTRGDLPANGIVLVHTVLAATATYFTVWCVATIFAFERSVIHGLACFACGALLLAVSVPCGRMLGRLGHRLPTLPGGFGNAQKRLIEAAASLRGRSAIAFYLVVGAGWLFYLGAWAVFGAAYPGLDAGQGLRLVGYYSLAWIVGFVAVFTPAGLGVREVAFLGLASEFPADVLAMTAVLGRVWLLLNDVVLGGVALLMTGKRHGER